MRAARLGTPGATPWGDVDRSGRYQRALVYLPPNAGDEGAGSCLELAHEVAPDVTVIEAEELAAEVWDCTIEPSSLAGSSEVSRTLSGLVLSHSHDLLVTCRQDASIERELLRTCPCPVWIGSRPRRPRRLLVALDPGCTPLSDPLADQVLRTGLELAEMWDAELHVVHAWTAYGQSLLRHRVPAEQIAAYVDCCRREAHEHLWQFLDYYRDRLDPSRVELVHGPPAGAVAAAARRHRVDVVVVGTAARRGVLAAMLGNTVERLLPRVDAQVVVVKSPNFVCPVRPELARAVVL